MICAVIFYRLLLLLVNHLIVLIIMIFLVLCLYESRAAEVAASARNSIHVFAASPTKEFIRVLANFTFGRRRSACEAKAIGGSCLGVHERVVEEG